jgi:hypothetical protein
VAYLYDVIKWTISGDCYNQGDIWTTSFYTGFDSVGVGDSYANDENAAIIADLWETFFHAGPSGFSERYRTLAVKGQTWASTILGGTHPVGEPGFHTYDTPPIGANTLSSMPPQISLVASFKSGWRTGKAANGRMFLPGVSFPVEASGGISTTHRDELAGTFLTFVDGVNAGLPFSDTGRIILAGQGDLVPGPAPMARNANVTKIRIGSYYDTQRRRRNGFTENYIESGVAA